MGRVASLAGRLTFAGRRQELLTRLGARIPSRAVHAAEAVARFLEVGRWMQAAGYTVPVRVDRREEVFRLALPELAHGRPLYLEFGVFRGATIRWWTQHLTNPAAVFHGFDTFEGLPETWTHGNPAGHFSTAGGPPRIDDRRVRFFVGRFDKTLPGYRPPDHDSLFVNLDADLYSSTMVALRALSDVIRRGSFLYFDEFSMPAHEMRAFADFTAESGLTFRVVGADRSLTHVLFRCTGSNPGRPRQP